METEDLYRVVINDEEQYSIWALWKDIPEGWYEVGVDGTEDKCLSYIEENWKDIRPLSLRKRLKELEDSEQEWEEIEVVEPSLIDRLISKKTAVEVVADGWSDFVREAANGYIHIKFTETNGGTEIGIDIPKISKSDLEKLKSKNEKLFVTSSFSLDYVNLEVKIWIDLSDLTGYSVLNKKD